MGGLNPVKLVKDIAHGVGDAYQSMLDGSRRIGEVLTGGASSKLTGPSTHTLKAIARSRPLIMPMPDEQALQEAQRKKFAGQVTSGRASTVLTSQSDDTLG